MLSRFAKNAFAFILSANWTTITAMFARGTAREDIFVLPFFVFWAYMTAFFFASMLEHWDRYVCYMLGE